jgi:hypothetical protein
VFELDGRRYEVRGHAMGGRFDLIRPDGEPVAAALRVGRKRWTVQAAVPLGVGERWPGLG